MKSTKALKSLLIISLVLSFGPLLFFVGYIIVITFRLFPSYFHFWPSASTFGVIWCFIAFIVAVYSLYNHRIGGICAIVIGVFFIVPVIVRHHYVDLYVPIASIYTVSGLINLVYSKLMKYD